MGDGLLFVTDVTANAEMLPLRLTMDFCNERILLTCVEGLLYGNSSFSTFSTVTTSL